MIVSQAGESADEILLREQHFLAVHSVPDSLVTNGTPRFEPTFDALQELQELPEERCNSVVWVHKRAP